MISALSKAGLENFSQYGKLIGTGKNNGIKVYEKLANGERVLTSVKDDTVRKIVTKHGNTVNAEDKINDTYTTVSRTHNEFSLHRENRKDGVSEYLNKKTVDSGCKKGKYSKFVKQGDADILDLMVEQEPYALGKNITIKSETGMNVGGQEIPKYEPHRFIDRDLTIRSFVRDESSIARNLDLNLAEAIWNAFRKLLS